MTLYALISYKLRTLNVHASIAFCQWRNDFAAFPIQPSANKGVKTCAFSPKTYRRFVYDFALNDAFAQVFKVGGCVCSQRPWAFLVNFQLKPIIASLDYDRKHCAYQ